MIATLALTAAWCSPLVLLAGAVAVGDRIYDRRQARNRPQIAPGTPTREESGRNREPLSAAPAHRGPVPAGQRLPVRIIPAGEPVSKQSGVTSKREDPVPETRWDRAA